MIAIKNYIQGLKSSWIKRLMNSPNSKLNILLNKSIETMLKTGSEFILCITNLVKQTPYGRKNLLLLKIYKIERNYLYGKNLLHNPYDIIRTL